jgi:hypothetical protein
MTLPGQAGYELLGRVHGRPPSATRRMASRNRASYRPRTRREHETGAGCKWKPARAAPECGAPMNPQPASNPPLLNPSVPKRRVRRDDHQGSRWTRSPRQSRSRATLEGRRARRGNRAMLRTASAKPPSRARGRSVGGRAGRHRPAGAFRADQAEIIGSCGRPENGPARWRGGRVRPARRKQDGEHGWRDLDGGRPARAFRMTRRDDYRSSCSRESPKRGH